MKRLFLLITALTFVLAVPVTARTVEQKTYENNIAYMGGYTDGTFRPNGTITRAESVTVVARLLFGEENLPESKSAYTDAQGHWSEKYIACLEKEGLLSAYKGNFSPDKPITRAEFADLAVKVCSLTPGVQRIFTDVPSSHTYYDSIMLSAASGLIGGYEDNTFRPDNTITRAEAVTILNRVQAIDTSRNIFSQNYNNLNHFSDINGHWARYDIIVASNTALSEYIPPKFGNIVIGGMNMKNNEIVLENSYFSYILSSDGRLISMFDKSGGKELSTGSEAFIYMLNRGNTLYPVSAVLEASKIVFSFENGEKITVTPTVKEGYIIFELSEYKGNATKIMFCNTVLDYETASDSDIAVLGISMSSTAITEVLPKASARHYWATAFKEAGIEGAKYAILATPEKYHLEALEALSKDCNGEEGIFAFSRFESEGEKLINTNYFLGKDGNHETVFNDLDLYISAGIDMYSFHRGVNTFRQGDFHFHNQSLKTAYKSVLTAYIEMMGLEGKHDYSYYMTPQGAKLLPAEHSKEFKYIGTYHFNEDISSTKRKIKLQGCNLTGDYYIAVENELMKVTLKNGASVELERKQGGTSPDEYSTSDDVIVFEVTGTGAYNFKKLVSDKMKENGIMTGLHTYAFYIDENCAEIIGDPYWQDQFIIQEEYTLAADLKKGAKNIYTVESLANADKTRNYRTKAWDLIIIDEEVIQINYNTLSGNTIQVFNRGHLGTTATEHKAGTIIRRIGSYYGALAPKIGSELFYYIAKLTAEAFNQGGFDMIYFDAIDGVKDHIPTKAEYGMYDYYTTEFIRATLQYCDKKPITEIYRPTQYMTHAYSAAFDYANRGFKEYMQVHSSYNQSYLDSYFHATMGWYNFYPELEPANTIFEYQHTDDIDMLGTLSLAYNYSMVFMNLESYRTNAKNKANIDRFVLYDKLRKEGYFSDEVLSQLRNTDKEYALKDKGNGSYALVEKHYDKARVHNIADKLFNYLDGTNPFNAQKPFIRIEADWSSKGEDAVVLKKYDETRPLDMQSRFITFAEPINAEGKNAVQVRVYGNGQGGAICISLESTVVADYNQMDYVIPINFTGWKEFTLVGTDSFLYPKEYFSHWHNLRKTYNFKIYRGEVDFGAISVMNIYTYGSMEDVKIDDVRLAKYENAPMVNPTVTLSNGDMLTFYCTLNSSEYIEYDGNKAFVYNSKGEKYEVEVDGGMTVKAGKYRARLTSNINNEITLRGKLTFGFTGEELK